MDIIKYKDIDLTSLNMCAIQGTQSRVLIKDDKCYKFVDTLYPEERVQLVKKFNDMEGIKVDNVLFPKELIMDGDTLVGYTMDYFPNSFNLFDRFARVKEIDVNSIFEATKKVSLILRELHENGIVLQDFTFDNILINGNGEVRVSDIDGCSYKGNHSPYLSVIMSNYYKKVCQHPKIDENLDRQSLFLSMLCSIYDDMVLGMKQYDLYSKEIKTLGDMRELFKTLMQSSGTQIPYLDEMLGEDHYIIDRALQKKYIER